jgi:hypothetical protein
MMLSVDHPRWHEFLDKLYEVMDWKEDPEKPGSFMWLCGKDGDRLGWAKATALGMGFEGLDLGGHHTCCDCEIIFNLDDRPED